MKYKVTNKTFSPLQIYGIGVIPARSSIEMYTVPKELRVMEKSNKLAIKEIKER
jgi:hypothetical protein